MEKYDSLDDTLTHIRQVQKYLLDFVTLLLDAGIQHDSTSMTDHEKSFYDKWRPILSEMRYGSDEYLRTIKELKPAIEHHYKTQRHHPEHFEDGINDMSLIDLIEMLCDWKAANLRDGGDIKNSIAVSRSRFGVSDQLARIFENTAKRMRWIGE